MRKVFAIALIVGLASMIAISLRGSSDKTGELKKADQDWNQAAQSKNVDQFMSFIRDDVYLWDLNGKWRHDAKDIKDDWEEVVDCSRCKVSWTADAAEVSKDGQMGYTRGTYQGITGDDSFSGGYTTIWKKDKGGKWRVAVFITARTAKE